MITVYDDAPEQNKELKERGTTDAGRLCLRAVGEPWFESRKIKIRLSWTDNLTFMVEVAGLELAASSTRNWRATNCATPRNIKPVVQDGKS